MLVFGISLLLLMKLFLATRLDLYSDEIFYWLASTRLALSYSDLPFMTSLLVWLGSATLPGSTLAARSVFILIGSSLPLLIYWLALPVTGRRHAMMSALLSLCIPLGGFLGLLAVPDVPLLFFGVLAIGCFDRALRTDRLIYWLATGVAVALGLSTHYRFFLYPVAAVGFLIVFRPQARQWKNSSLWISIGIAGLGLLPIAWFNLSNQLASASFYLVERHPWSFNATGLLHIFKQAGLVTPPLYVLFGFTLWTMIRRSQQGDCSAAVFTSFALTNLLVYMVLAPWTDSNSTSIHWPLSGYFPLLVYAPATLESLFQWTRERYNPRTAVLVSVGIPCLGFLGSITALAGVGSQAFQTPLQSLLGPGILSNKMAGWREFSNHTSHLITHHYQQHPVIITDNYYTAAQLQFAGVAERTFTVDDDKAIEDGRRLQLSLWEMDESALARYTGKPALFITEDSTLTVVEKEDVMAAVCRHVREIDHFEDLSLFRGDKNFSYYMATSIVTSPEQSALQSGACPYPARAWIDSPIADADLSGVIKIEGWAFNEDIGIAAVSLLLNGEEIRKLNYGISRPDVVQAIPVNSDPNAPNLGYTGELDTRTFPNGSYILAIRLTDNRGVSTVYGERSVLIAN